MASEPASSMEMLTEAAQARIESQGENQALVIRQQFMDAYQYGHGERPWLAGIVTNCKIEIEKGIFNRIKIHLKKSSR